MDLSSAVGALRTLRHRQNVSDAIVRTCEGLLGLLDPSQAPTGTNSADPVEGEPMEIDAVDPAMKTIRETPRAKLECGLTTMLVFGKERWEPIAVVCLAVRDQLRELYEKLDAQAEIKQMDQAQRQAMDQEVKETDALPLSHEFLTSVVRSVVKDNLEHWEPRVRMSVAKMLGVLARWDLDYVMTEFLPLVVESILCNLTRSPDFEEEGEKFGEADDNISVNGMESPVSSPKGTPVMMSTPGTPYKFDDVSGWRALESSLSVFKFVVRGSGAAFVATKSVESEDFTYFTPELRELMTVKSAFHVNRHVRAVGLATVAELCDAAPEGWLEAHRKITDEYCKCIVRGMQDNWSQVRYVACIATRAFLMKLRKETREEFFGLFIPRICLNRYYVAERVQKHSQETWIMIMGDHGRFMVARYIQQVVDYYVEMTSHAVREAACHSIAELANKVAHDAVRPHVPRLLEALIYSFHDNSWLVRDAACLASAQFVLAYPDESHASLELLNHHWFEQLSDEIWSLREDAAVALGNVIRAYGDEALARVENITDECIDLAKTQPAMSQTEYDEQMKSEKKHLSKQAFSCCALEPKFDTPHEHHDAEPWEKTDGAIYLVRELCAVAPEVGVRLLPRVADVAILRHFPQTAVLQETIWKQLPEMCEGLGKRVFKQYLELFLDPLMFTIQGSNRLARFAARDCVARLAAMIGPNIFLGRLEANPAWVESMASLVRSR